MIRTYSDNAILAKVKAMYGKRLTESDYEQLLQKKTVGEVAAYLKKETCYAEHLQEVREELIHRGQLENLVRRRVLGTYLGLLRYSYHETLFLKMYVMQNEIEQILMAVRLLNSGGTERYIVTLPVHLARLMSFDLFALARIHSFDDLLAVLEHSAYFHIATAFRPSGAHRIADITTLEAALLTHYYNTAAAAAKREYSGETRAALLRLIYYRLDVHNISVIYRMRRYLGAGVDMIAPRIVRAEGGENRLIDQLLDAPDLPAMRRILDGARWSRRFQRVWEQDTQARRFRQKADRRVFRFSTKPAVAAMSYMTLLETEIANIIHIIEGIRYGVPPSEIRELLAI